MIQRYSLATTRQLELSCIASTSTFLLPFFSINSSTTNHNSQPSPSSNRSIRNPKPSTSTLKPTSPIKKQRKVYGDVLQLMQNQVKEVLGKGNERVGRSCEKSLSRSMLLSASVRDVKGKGIQSLYNRNEPRRSYGTATINNLNFEEVEEEVKDEVAKKKFIIQSSSEDNTTVIRRKESIDSTSLLKKEGWSRSLLVDPPDEDSLTSTEHFRSLDSRITLNRTRFPPLLPETLSRKQLMNLLSSIPDTASTSYLLRVRAMMIRDKRVDDTGPVILFVNACLRKDLNTVALRFIKQSVNERINSQLSSTHLFDSSLRILNQKEDWETLDTFSSVALARTKTLSIFKFRLRALYETKQYNKVISVFNQILESTDLIPDGECYDELVGAHMMSGNLVLAQSTLARKQELGLPTTVRTCIGLLDGMWQFGGNKIMEEKMLNDVLRDTIRCKTALRQDIRILNRILSIRAARGDLESALSVLRFFDLRHLPTEFLPTLPKSLNASSSSFQLKPVSTSKPMDSNSSTSIHQIIASTRGRKPRPDLATFVTLINIANRLEQFDIARTLFLKSQKLNLGLNDFMITALVKTCLASEKNSINLAKEFVFALPNGNTVIPGSTIVVEQPFEPTAMIYEILLNGILKSQGLEGASIFLNRMIIERKRSIEITQGIVDVIVRHLTLDGSASIKTTAGFILKMKNMTKSIRRPTIKNLNAILEAAWRKDRFNKVGGRKKVKLNLLPIESDSTTSSTPSSTILTPPLFSTSFNTLPTSMSRIRKSLSDRGIQNDRETTQQVLRNDKAFETVDSMWEYLSTQLVERGIQPTYQHIAIIMRSYIKLGDLDGARSVLIKCKDLGVNLHVSLYSVLISGAAKLGYPEIAQELYREMKKAGISPDLSLYTNLALECAKFGDVAGVDSILAEASRKLDTPISTINPIITLIRYKALITSGRLSNAQVYMSTKLKLGLKPDLAVLQVLTTTVRWLQRKLRGRNTRKSSRSKLFSNLEIVLEEAEKNLKQVKLMMSEKKKSSAGQLKLFEKVLEKSMKVRKGDNVDMTIKF